MIMATPVPPAAGNAATRRKRQAARAAQGAGTVAAACGIGAVVCGGVLPWATLTIWSLPFALPGLVFAWGGASVGAALMAGGRLGQKRFPWLIAVLGLLPFCAGVAAPKIAGQAVRGFMLQWENTLAPTNARLAQAALPPIEPFAGIGPAASYVGPGVTWTLWGGVAMLLGGTLFVVGERTTRTCFICWRAWASARTGQISFCPSCGVFSAPLGPGRCTTCRTPFHKRDKFCAVCGTPAASVV